MIVGLTRTKSFVLGFVASYSALLIAVPEATLADAPTSQPAPVANVLDQPVGDVSIQGKPFKDVMDSIEDRTGVNFWIDYKALEYASISKAAPVTVNLHDAKLSDELDAIFKSVQGKDDDSKMAYTFEEGYLKITTQHALDIFQTDIRRYDIQDLLNDGFPRDEEIKDLEKYIMDHVATGKWKADDPPFWSISGSTKVSVLIICQSPKNHKKIEQLLADLRARGGLHPGI
jgi:hypothetical protein